MNLDLRIPMGLMFTIVGAIMAIFGFFTRGNVMYEKSAGMDINLIWGAVMLVFGACMLLLGKRGQNRPPAPTTSNEPRRTHGGH